MADCKKIIQLVHDHRERGMRDKTEAVGAKALWVAAKFVFSKVVGKAGGPVMELLKPTALGTGVDGYHDTLKKLLVAKEDGADAERLSSLVDNLKMWEDHIRIEREFGGHSNCYDSIRAITNDAERLLESKTAPLS